MGKFLMSASKSCDSCKSAAAVLFCLTDSAFLCIACDSGHSSSTAARQVKHERVWICDLCKQAPVTITCRADAASLCVTCDHDIHSANPFANRHERQPVSSFYDTAHSLLLKCSSAALTAATFDFDSTNSSPAIMIPPGPADNFFDIDFCTSSMDVGVVPEGSSVSDISYPLNKLTKPGSDLDGSVNRVQALSRDREARVLRYRQKRKNRRFEKTIRYASRKAYAETRPRIKGRFAKQNDLDPVFIPGSPACYLVGEYDVVPLFY